MIAMVSDDVDLNNQAASNDGNNSNRNNKDEEDDRFAGKYFLTAVLKSNTATGYATIRGYLDAGGCVNYMSQYGETALHVAAAYSSPSTVSWLLERGAKVNVQDVSGYTPLIWACLKQRLESVRLLLAAGADVNIVSSSTGPLHAAAHLGNDRIVGELLARNVDGEKKRTEANIQTTVTKVTALHAACSSNHKNSVKIVQMLLGSNASVTCKDYQGKSALDVATPVIKNLLESKNRKSSSSGISINTKSNDTVVQQQGQQQPDSSDVTLGDDIEVETAVRRGDYAYFKHYVKVADNDLTIRCANGNTLLHEAALHLPPGAIDILIFHGLHVDEANSAGKTALMLACENESVGVVERLLANGASANTYYSRRKGATLLHVAALNSRVGIVRALVRFGHILVDVVDFNRHTPLMCACRVGYSDRSQACIRELIDLGANINYQSRNGNTVLHHAAQNKHSSEILKLLLSYHQSNVGVKNAAKQTALKVACDKQNLAAIKLLLEHGALLSEQERNPISDECKSVFTEYDNKCKSVVTAVISNDKIFLQNFIQEPGNVNIRIRGCSLLHIAAARADRDMIKLLIKAGLHVDVRNAAKETPLIVACRGNKVENVQALLKECRPNADINARTGYGSSVLHVVAKHSCMDVLEYLLTSYPRMDVNCRDNCDRTPLTVACLAGNEAAARRIMKMDDCDINAIDYYSSPLHGAVYYDHQDLVAYLLGQGTIRVNAATIADHQTPLHVALRRGRQKIAEMLRNGQPAGDNLNLEDLYGRLPGHFGNATFAIEGNAIAPTDSNVSSDETALNLQTASSNGETITNASQPITEALVMAQNITSPSGHLTGEGTAAVATRGDTADCHTLLVPIENDFNPDPLDWKRTAGKHISKHQADLIDHMDITMTFADSMRSAGFLVQSEYNALDAIHDQTNRSREFIAKILPKKDYAAFEFVIKALNDAGNTATAAYCRQILNEIKADIEGRKNQLQPV